MTQQSKLGHTAEQRQVSGITPRLPDKRNCCSSKTSRPERAVRATSPASTHLSREYHSGLCYASCGEIMSQNSKVLMVTGLCLTGPSHSLPPFPLRVQGSPGMPNGVMSILSWKGGVQYRSRGGSSSEVERGLGQRADTKNKYEETGLEQASQAPEGHRHTRYQGDI